MTPTQSYKALLSHLSQTQVLSQISGLIAWDQETMMPPGGLEARARQLSVLAGVIHRRMSDPKIADWLQKIDANTLGQTERANLTEATRAYRRAKMLPQTLVKEQAQLHSRAQALWTQARQTEALAAFLPTLAEVVRLKREEARCLKGDGDTLYDALLDDFEPGARITHLDPIMSELKVGLIPLREQIVGALPVDKACVTARVGRVDKNSQLALARRVATAFGYDWQRGRLDISAHPFSCGYRSDARITTRIDPDNFLDCLYSTIHEVGHAVYEQGSDPALDLTPSGQYASMGIHESQSRMFENQIGRSRAFINWLYGIIQEQCGDIGVGDAEALYALVNRITPGFIRTEADEVHYNLHILLRYELEQALINNAMPVADLDAAWRERFRDLFGLEIKKPSQGILQDVHWSCGLFGYFPTYTLGNIYAAELFAKMKDTMPELERDMADGRLEPVRDWLNAAIHRHGRIYEPDRLIARALGRPAKADTFLKYLEAKYL